jgi:peptidoglycan/xylan/chitin deacetylase (PgdA/CDA1 family)
MRIPGIKTARLFSKWLQGRLLGGALILGYHHVSTVNDDDGELSVSPDHFREHLEIIRQRAHPIHLSELVHHLHQGKIPRKSVVVTFDDGYADNLLNAVPLLEQYQIPATVFVCTDYFGKEFWWDELKRLIINAPAHPNTLHLKIGGNQFDWSTSFSGQQVSNPADVNDRMRLLNLLYARLLPLDSEERGNVIGQVRLWSGDHEKYTGSNRALTTEELRELAGSELIEIGSHTVTHPILTQMTLEQQTMEIQHSKDTLEQVIGKTVPGFAYPNGKFSAETLGLVQQAGYAYACSSQKELARQPQQCYALPRLWPQDWDGKQFSRYLKLWTGT